MGKSKSTAKVNPALELIDSLIKDNLILHSRLTALTESLFKEVSLLKTELVQLRSTTDLVQGEVGYLTRVVKDGVLSDELSQLPDIENTKIDLSIHKD